MKLSLTIFVFCSLFLAAACSQAAATENLGVEGDDMEKITFSSPAFDAGGDIPLLFTCDGENISPPLEWSGVPSDASSLVLIMDDPDAPRGTWVHWVVTDIAPGLTDLPEGVVEYSGAIPIGIPGKNSSNKEQYNGPCPPSGPAHRYFFKLYALDTTLGLPAGATKAQVEQAMQGHVLAYGELMGKYGR